MKHLSHLVVVLALISFSSLPACHDDNAAPPLTFTPGTFIAPDAVPDLTSSGTVRLSNDSGATYQLTHISITAAVQADAERFAWAPPEGVLMPLDLAPGETIDLTVFFTPQEEESYAASLTAQLWMLDYEIGGGGCSSGCGREAPTSTETFVVALLQGTGSNDAQSEDCEDGEDNDGDTLVDCDDPDCQTFPGCAPGSEICDDGIDNDGDEQIDCEDSDCEEHPDCAPPNENCDDGIDNDGDGQVDCDDSDCAAFPGCATIVGCTPSGLINCGEDHFDNTQSAENNFSSYCDSTSGGWDGPEHIWAFFAESGGEIQVSARRIGGGGGPGPGGGGPGGNWDLDLTVLRGDLEDKEVVCDPTQCVANSWSPPNVNEESVNFEAEAGELFFIVIDGWDGDAGEYELSVECDTGPEGESDCGDGIDNDGDGDTDCEDSDCFGSPDCAGSGDCLPTGPVSCGLTTSSANNASGSTDEVTDWCGEGLDLWTGPEIAFLYFPESSGEVSVRLDGLSADLDLSILIANTAGAPQDACNPNLCIDDPQHWRPGAQPEVATFSAFAGSAYIIAVDGWDGAVSDFNLELSCGVTPGTEFDCDDGIDNDADGATDCDDSDCLPQPVCQGVDVEVCNDGVDNDGDGDSDCDDIEDCNTFPGCDYGDGDCCVTNGSPGCDNDLGEDCVCEIDSFCCGGVWDPLCINLFVNECGGTCGGPITETDCVNNVDDDGDGLVDCDDADCDTEPTCLIPETEIDCTNNFDDDVDGLLDCDDPDCLTHPSCSGPANETDCANSVDDDGDGAIDCDDPDCLNAVNCQPPGVEDCTNGADDDGDGAIDCADTDCTFEPSCDAGDGDCCSANGTPGCSDESGEDCVCASDAYCCNNLWDSICVDLYLTGCGGSCTGVEDCSNGLDDDFDSAIDCFDTDCLGAPNCGPPTTEISCTDGIDNDIDGATDCADTDCDPDPACAPPPTESNCGNLADDDGDSLIDCADPDCATDPLCNLPGTETNCADGLDNDGDAAIDCDDFDCVADPNCNIFVIEVDCFDGLDNDSDGAIDCDDSDCAALPSCSLSPEADCDNGIDDDADSFTDCNDSDCATDPNCATGETDCGDGLDNDGDGDIDCDDGDCSAAVECVTTGDCNPIGNLGCGAVINGSNDMIGSTDQQTEFCGNPLGPGWHGPEVAWVFSPEDDSQVDITLTGLTADLDIMVLVQDPQGCDENDCEASGWNPPPQPEQMDWYAFSGVPYYIVIDGWNGAVSDFTMTITCTPSTETDCSDGVDEDLDGDIDCADIDCLGNLACPETNCTDSIDNDADGFSDCSDPDCAGAPTCLPELNCIDGLDNDLDGAVDCDDSDCNSAALCLPETACADALDNDLDGSVDCADTDCASDANCLFESDCSDTVDNDSDGLTDCADSDCAIDPFCATIQCTPSSGIIGCGDVVVGDSGLGVNDLDIYCGGTATNLTGPEHYYTLNSEAAQNATVTLSAMSEDLDLLAILSDAQGECLPANCLAYSPEVGVSSESITVPMGPGDDVQLVVDGVAGADSLYMLSVSCAPTTGIEICTDGLDNDGDGDEDCFDPDCSAEPTCNAETACADSFDNDADGLADCNDSDCFGTPGCPLILFSSVDDDPGDFVHVALGSHQSNTDWEQGAPDTPPQSGNGPLGAHTGSLAWCTGCDTQAHAGGEFFAALVAQPLVFDLSTITTGTLELSWYHWAVIPTGFNFDVARVEVSDDGGASTDTAWGPAPASTSSWDFVTIDLSPYLGGDLTFSFVYDSVPFFFGGGSNADGWYVDDVVLTWYP